MILTGVGETVAKHDQQWQGIVMKAIIKTRAAVKGKGKSKLRAIIQLEHLEWLVEREVNWVVRRWKERAEEEGGREESGAVQDVTKPSRTTARKRTTEKSTETTGGRRGRGRRRTMAQEMERGGEATGGQKARGDITTPSPIATTLIVPELVNIEGPKHRTEEERTTVVPVLVSAPGRSDEETGGGTQQTKERNNGEDELRTLSQSLAEVEREDNSRINQPSRREI